MSEFYTADTKHTICREHQQEDTPHRDLCLCYQVPQTRGNSQCAKAVYAESLRQMARRGDLNWYLDNQLTRSKEEVAT